MEEKDRIFDKNEQDNKENMDEKKKLCRSMFFCFSDCWRGLMSGIRNFELKPAELALLSILAYCDEGSQGLKASQISRKMQVTQPTVTPIIHNLQKKGMVVRTPDPDDRRAVKVCITDKGNQTLKKCAANFEQKFDAFITEIGKERASELTELLREASKYFRENPLDADSEGKDNAQEQLPHESCNANLTT